MQRLCGRLGLDAPRRFAYKFELQTLRLTRLTLYIRRHEKVPDGNPGFFYFRDRGTNFLQLQDCSGSRIAPLSPSNSFSPISSNNLTPVQALSFVPVMGRLWASASWPHLQRGRSLLMYAILSPFTISKQGKFSHSGVCGDSSLRFGVGRFSVADQTLEGFLINGQIIAAVS